MKAASRLVGQITSEAGMVTALRRRETGSDALQGMGRQGLTSMARSSETLGSGILSVRNPATVAETARDDGLPLVPKQLVERWATAERTLRTIHSAGAAIDRRHQAAISLGDKIWLDHVCTNDLNRMPRCRACMLVKGPSLHRIAISVEAVGSTFNLRWTRVAVDGM